MTWQEELRRLDAALAAGSLTVEQHRRQREEVLARASSAPVLAPAGLRRESGETTTTAPSTPSTSQEAPPEPAPGPVQEPETPPASEQPEQPQPPAPAEPPEPPARPPAKTAGAASLLFTERPTTAPSPADKNATDAMPYPRSSAPPQRSVELTMPLGRIPVSPTGDPAPPPLPIPPAGGTAKPPKPPKAPKAKKPPKPPRTDTAQDAGYTEPPEDRGRRGTWLLISLGVLVALGAVVGGAWWLGNGNTTTSDQSAVAAPGPRQEVSLENRLPKLPGRPNPQNSTMSVDRGAELGLYTGDDAKAMHDNGADEVVYRASAEGEKLTDGYTVIVIPTSSDANAKDLSGQLSDTITTQGFSRESLGDAPYVALSRTDTSARVSVVWYSSGDTTVGVGVSQAASGAPEQLRERLIRTLTSVDGVLPRG